MGEPVRIGIIGCGYIGKQYLMNANPADPSVRIVAVADVNRDAAVQAAREYGVQNVYTDGIELIDDPQVQGIVMALPTFSRFELILHAFGKGKHVLNEKPVAMNADQVLQYMASAKGAVFANGSSRFLYQQSAVELKKFVASGALGALRCVRSRVIKQAATRPVNPVFWRFNTGINGGGIMANWGVYDINYLLDVTGWQLRPKTVLAQTWTVPPLLHNHVAPGSDGETHAIALIQCDGGTVISLERGESVIAAAEDLWQLIGEHGSVSFQMYSPGESQIVYCKADPELGMTREVIWSGTDTPDLISKSLHDFAAAIRGEQEPRTNMERGLLIQQITDAIYRSSQTGAPVNMNRDAV